MSVNEKIRFAIINLCFVFICNAQVDYFNSANWQDENYLDPHSFYYEKHTKEETLPSGDNDNHEIGHFKGSDASECYKQLHKCETAQNTDVADELLSRRIVNMIISRGQLKKDGSYFNGRIELEASESELEALKNFGQGKLTLREVDPIINKVIQAPAIDLVHETAIWIHTASAFLMNLLLPLWTFLSDHKEYVAIAVALPCSFFFLKKARLNFWIVLTVSIQIIFVSSFFITYWRLIQEAKIKHTAAQMKNIEVPVQCHPDKMGILDKVFSFWRETTCEEHIAAVVRNPFYEVTPAQALAHMFTVTMLEPLALSGKFISTFLKNLTDHMWWPLSWFVQTIFLLGLLPVAILFIILICGGTLNLGFGPFSLFSLRGPRNSAPRQNERLDSKENRQPIEVLLNVTANVQLPPSIVEGAGQSNNPSITYSECCGKDRQRKSIQAKPITCHDKASGDSEIENITSNDFDEEKPEVEFQKPLFEERGSGDHSCIDEEICKT